MNYRIEHAEREEGFVADDEGCLVIEEWQVLDSTTNRVVATCRTEDDAKLVASALAVESAGMRIPRRVVAGLFRAAEFKEREENGLWDDDCRHAVEWMRANVAPHASQMDPK